jgi:hypothetical protein
MGRKQMLQQIGGILGKAMGGIRAYHGTPHKFAPEPGAPYGRFRDSAIGTGEGAQVYGRGHYLAEEEAVAREYRDQLSQGRLEFSTPAGDRANVSMHTPDRALQAYQLRGKPSYVAEYALNELRRGKTVDEALAAARRDYAHFEPDAVAEAESIVRRMNPSLTSGGHVYEVNINADPRRFLDWDRPLSRQDEPVRRVVEPLVADDLQRAAEARRRGGPPEVGKPFTPDQMEGYSTTDDPTGHLIYNLMRKRANPAEATDIAATRVLRDAGVPGIKFLDQNSRYGSPEAIEKIKNELLTVQGFVDTTTDPMRRLRYAQQVVILKNKLEAAKAALAKGLTNNFSVFDPKIIQIVRRFGLFGAVSSGLISREMADQMREAGYPDQPMKGVPNGT